MSKHIRFTALLLAVSLLCNTAFPAFAEGSVDANTVIEETITSTPAAALPTEETTAPTTEPTASDEMTIASDQETLTSDQETTASDQDATASDQDATASDQDATASDQDATASDQDATASDQDATASDQDATASDQDATASDQEVVIATGTVVCSTSVNIRSGPGTDYAVVDAAYNGHFVKIYEIVRVADTDWGRIGQGRWICLTYVQLDSDDPPQPTEESSEPTEEASEPTEEASEPTGEASEPTEEASEPTEEASEPTEEASEPTEESSEPTEESSEPSEEASEPAEESSEPTEESSEPTEESSEPTEEPSEPTEEPSEPTEEPSEPTEEPSDPTEEPTEPSSKDLCTQIDEILSAEVLPGQMSLTWWALRCGKLDIDALLSAEALANSEAQAATEVPADSVALANTETPADPVALADTEAPADTEPTADPESTADPEAPADPEAGQVVPPPVLDYVPENNTLYITSSQDLLLLSYVEAQAYCDLTLECFPTSEEHQGFDLLEQPEGPAFLGLGSLDSPFSGKVRFAEGTGPILLENPLFIALSDDAELIHVALECHAEEALEGGLLTKYVTHQKGGNTWSISLERPESEDPTPMYLPPLLGSLAAQSEVALELTDRSGLQVLGSGYLCGVMEAEAQLLVSGLSAVPTVTGFSENVGGLVGLMKSEASLIVFGETLQLSGVTGSHHVGGAVGSACDPILSLPTLVGEDGASIRGEHVGGLAGSLTLSPGEHAITQNVANLTLEGSANAGGLFGVLCQEDATLILNAAADNLTFVESDQGNYGSIFGSFQSASLDNALIFNGEPVVGWSGFEELSGSIQSESPAITVEEAQRLLDEIANAELVPGEMSLLWWAVINGKITAEEYAAELNGTTAETEPTEENPSTEEPQPTEEIPSIEEPQPTEEIPSTEESTQASQPAEETEPTGQTEATEETPLPLDDARGEEPDAAQEDILLPEDVLLADFSPMAASFSMNREAPPALLSLEESGGDTETLPTEETENATSVTPDNEAAVDSPSPLEAADNPDPSTDWPEGTPQFQIKESADLVTLSYVAPSVYADGAIQINTTNSFDLTTPCEITLPDGSTKELYFWGLGNSDYPFSGSVELSGTSVSTYIKLNSPLFNHLSDKAAIGTLNLYSGPNPNTALLAGHIQHKDDVTASNTWGINLKGIQGWNSLPLIGTIEKGSLVTVNLALCVGTLDAVESDDSITSVDSCAYFTIQGGGYLCHLMEDQASLTVNLLPGKALGEGGVSTAVGIPNVTSAGHTGGLVGQMGTGATLIVTADGSLPVNHITSTNGNAGGLVGITEAGASVTLTLQGDEAALSISSVEATESAGGLIGQATNLPFSEPSELPNITGSDITITGSNAGGLIGSLTVNTNRDFSLSSRIPEMTIVGDASSGGLFGSLQNGGFAFTISDFNTHVTFTDDNESAIAGGLIGSYAAKGLDDTLILSNNTTSSTLAKPISAYGGLIGYISSAAYVQVSSGTVNTTETATPTYFGGLVANMDNSGSFLWVGTPPTSSDTPAPQTDPGVTLNLDKIAGTGARGGVVGNMPSGVISFSLIPDINASSVVSSTDNDNRGWILGSRGNTLVYTTAANWPAPPDNLKVNDTGVWGQVLRVDGALSGLLTFDTTNHTVTVAGEASADIKVNNATDLAALALRLQLNPIGALSFTDTDPTKGITISLAAEVNLSNTGLTCLMQDRYDTTDYPITIQGGGHTITLPSVKVYVSETHKTHNRQGLISRAKTLTAANLTITTDGTGYHTHVLTAKNSFENELNVGMLAAEVVGIISEVAVKLTNVTSTANIIVSSDGATKAKVAGFIGVIDIDVRNTHLESCTWKGSITDSCESSTYLGGFISIYSNTTTTPNSTITNISSKDCTISGTIHKTKLTRNLAYAPVGGFICTLYYGTTYLTIENLNADGVEITIKEGDKVNPAKCGGILSYDWVRINATVVGLTVKNCTLEYPTTPTNTPHFGALVYKASGIVTLGDGQGKAGITFESNNTITGFSPTKTPSSLFIAYGSEASEGVYLQVLQGGYDIKPNSVELDLTYQDDNKKYFDELVGITRVSSSERMGIVSIATAERKIDESRRNTYNNKLTDIKGKSYTNPYTRYYYDLDEFRGRSDGNFNAESTASGAVDKSQKMVLYSAWGNCTSNLRNYFYKSPGAITGTLNLTGYSYYPIPLSGQSQENATIQYATITFNHQKLVSTEGNNKSPSVQDNQHTLMHTGIFLNMKLGVTENFTPTKTTVSVKNLTLQGNIGQRMDQDNVHSYGALFCGEVYGANVDYIAKLEIDGIKLNGIRVYDRKTGNLNVPNDTTAPLLMANIGNYVTLDMKNVETTSAYTDTDTDTDTNTYAATSLIGIVGSDTGTNIKLTFANMALDGRTEGNTTLVHGTKRTIFKTALFIGTFQYTDVSTCKGVYNFINDKNVRYSCGQELSNSEAGSVSGRNNDEQFHFFKSLDDMVYLAVDPKTEKNEKTYFATGYRRYVGNSEGQNGELTYHELDVNLWKAPLDKGCGTYSHPYIIYNGKQLMALAEALEYGTNEGWEVNLNSKVLGRTFNQQDGHIDDKCEDDRLYTCAGDTWTVAAPGTPAKSTDVLNYLRNAYYLIQPETDSEGNNLIITLGSKWAGLGKASETGAFSGVIAGAGDNAIIQITANTTSVYQYGGLIKCSMGSVVKDVTIQYTGSPLILSDAIPSINNLGTVSFFGGVVGWCMGGDTILDNVNVTFSGSPTVSGANSHLSALGGYVGLVGGGTDIGGFGGGVVFRNISESNFSGDSSRLYVNPYVGRVLDGYAMSEGSALNNTNQNYNIPGITVNKDHLSMSEGAIQINDREGLWVLSAIVNSGMNETAYTYGKPRMADYSGIGTANAQLEDEGCLGGTTGNRGRAYLSKFTDIPSLTGPFTLTFTNNCDVSGIGNGFRGLGGSYGTVNSNRMLTVSTVTSSGDAKTITLGQDRREYANEAETWTSIGAGLFPVLDSSSSPTVSNLNMAGSTGITYYDANGSDTANPIPGDKMLMDVTPNSSTKPYRLGSSGAGLLAGTMKKATSGTPSITLKNLTVSGEVSGNATFAGGLIGLACINSSGSPFIQSLTIEDCVYQGLTVSGHACVGGFLGYAFADTLAIKGTSEKTMSGLTVTSGSAAVDGALTGVGGLIGRCDTRELTIGGTGDGKLIFSENLSVTNGNTTSTPDRTFTGGLAGLLGIREGGSAAIRNIAMNANVSISNSSIQNSSGALAGALAYYGKEPFKKEAVASDQWDLDNSGNVQVTASGIDIAADGAGSVTIETTKQGGTLFGWLKVASANLEEKIQIGSQSGTISLNTTKEVENASLGGLIGVVSHANPLTLSDITLNNIHVWGLPSTTDRGAALVVGYAEKNAVIKIRNAMMQGCSVAVGKNSANAGFLYAHFDGSSVAGFQILIDNCDIGLSIDDEGQKKIDAVSPASTGLFGGKAKDKTVKLVGVRVKKCSAPIRDFADESGTKYAVRADYTGIATVPTAITTVPTVTSHGLSLSSDGIGLADTKPYAQQIIKEATENSNGNIYFNVSEEIQAFNASASVSNFRVQVDAENENAFPEDFTDFSVLVINSNEGTNADGIIRNYISILTNVPDSKLHITESDFELNCYHWENDAFTADNSRASLVWNASSRKISVTPGGYDNQKMQFTLMKVTYDDPTESGQTYDLYIPIIVKKVLQFRFWASAENGSSYNAAHYADLQQSAIGSNKDLITSLLTFQYQWTKAEWQAAVDSGSPLLWNFDKEILLNHDGSPLSPTTRLTLVDRNDQSKAYYGNISSNTISFSSLSSLTEGKQWDSGNTPLCDLLKLKETEPEEGDAKFVRCSKDDSPTLRIGEVYYRPATDSDENYCSIKVGLGDGELVEETYYLTFQTQDSAEEETVYNFLIQCKSRLKNPKGNGMPTQLTYNDAGHMYVQNKSENRLVISNFFSQRFTVSTDDSAEVMSATENTLSGTLTSTVWFSSNDAYKDFMAQKGESRNLQEGFCLYLRDQDGKPVPFPEGTTIVIDGDNSKPISVEPGYSCWLPEKAITSWSLNADKKYSAQVETKFTLKFTPQGIADTFPERTTPGEGIRVFASSSLSLDPTALQRSNQRVGPEMDNKGRLFYRTDTSVASLTYNAYQIVGGSQGKGLSQLGINGLEKGSFDITTSGIYNVSDLKNADNAKYLICTLTLSPKNPSGGDDYPNEVENMAEYLDKAQISTTINDQNGQSFTAQVVDNATGQTSADIRSGSVCFDLTNEGVPFDKNIPIQIDIDLSVITGSAFEKKGFSYANYRVQLTATLLDESKEPLNGSSASDYIIYTNAKVLFSKVSKDAAPSTP